MFTLAPPGTWRSEIVVRKSRFIATLTKVDDIQQAREAISAIKADFPDARHNCSAYTVLDGSVTRSQSSDDGEPSGTAGTPILGALQNADLVNVACVVTRYFGGILLGTGGLARAYSAATEEVVAKAHLAQQQTLTQLRVAVDAGAAGRFESEVHRRAWLLQDSQWGADLVATVAVRPEQAVEVASLAAALTQRPARIEELGRVVVEVPLDPPNPLS